MIKWGVALGMLLVVMSNISEGIFPTDVMKDFNSGERISREDISVFKRASLSFNKSQPSKRKKLYSKRVLKGIYILKFPFPSFPYRLKGRRLAKITGYEPSFMSCGKFADGKTSIMRDAYQLTGVAADPAVLPYGTVVYIPGVGYRTVDDTGSAMKKSWRRKGELHLDLRFLTVSQALRWGIKYKEVEIYERVKGGEDKPRALARSTN
jgi:3D (Asp-Asp-Asp) domain-containing protein